MPPVFIPTYQPVRNLVTEAMGDEALVLHLERNTCFALNAVGALIWHRLAAGDDVAQIARLIVAHFETTAEQASEDVREFIESLLVQGLVEPRQHSVVL